MAYMSDKWLSTLSEQDQLMFHLIGRLEDQAVLYEELSSPEGHTRVFESIKFLVRELARLWE